MYNSYLTEIFYIKIVLVRKRKKEQMETSFFHLYAFRSRELFIDALYTYSSSAALAALITRTAPATDLSKSD